MKITSRGVALVIALTAAPGAHAQMLTAEPVLKPAPAAPDLVLTARRSPVRDALFRNRPGIGIASRTFTQPDGAITLQRGLIGSVEIARGLEAGVGLFSISGDARKINETKRGWSVKEVNPKRGNIAAVGMRFRF